MYYRNAVNDNPTGLVPSLFLFTFQLSYLVYAQLLRWRVWHMVQMVLATVPKTAHLTYALLSTALAYLDHAPSFLAPSALRPEVAACLVPVLVVTLGSLSGG